VDNELGALSYRDGGHMHNEINDIVEGDYTSRIMNIDESH